MKDHTLFLLILLPKQYSQCWVTCSFIFFSKTLFIYFQREGKGRRKTLNVGGAQIHCFSHAPNCGLSLQPFSSQTSTKSTEPHEPAHMFCL